MEKMFAKKNNNSYRLYPALLGTGAVPQRIFVTEAAKTKIISLTEVLSVTKSGKNTCILLKNGTKLISSTSFRKSLNIILHNPAFIRAGLFTIVNKTEIKSVKGNLVLKVIEFKDGAKVKVWMAKNNFLETKTLSSYIRLEKAVSAVVRFIKFYFWQVEKPQQFSYK